MIVYVVTTGNVYEGEDIFGVYSSLEKARDSVPDIEWGPEEWVHYIDKYQFARIQEWKVQ